MEALPTHALRTTRSRGQWEAVGGGAWNIISPYLNRLLGVLELNRWFLNNFNPAVTQMIAEIQQLECDVQRSVREEQHVLLNPNLLCLTLH